MRFCRRNRLLFCLVFGAGGLALLGCVPPELQTQITQLEEGNRRLKIELDASNRQITEQADVIARQAKQIQTLVAIGPDRLEKLYYPTRIVLDELTGGADYDGKPGDDGVTVYLRPIDQDGHVIKAAGDIHIQLLDLAMPDGQKTIGEYTLDVDHARQHWYGRFLTQHYTIKCEWRPGKGPPTHSEITVRAEFTEYLTGKKLTAMSAVHVTLLPGASATVK